MTGKEEFCACEIIHEDTVREVAAELCDKDEYVALASLFKLFGDSTRLRILWALHSAEMCVQGISLAVGMSVSAVSHQLKTLKDAHLVKSRREGKQIYYSICDHHIMEILDTALEHIREE